MHHFWRVIQLTPGFKLPAKYIIHAVSPCYIDGACDEEKKLRDCYRKSLRLASEYQCKSIAFPLIATGNFCYPKEEGMRIALDEINAFLIQQEMLVYLVVFDTEATRLGLNLYPDLEEYIDHNYVYEKQKEEYCECINKKAVCESIIMPAGACFDFLEENESALEERMQHMSDTFQEYLMYLISSKKLTNAEVYKRAIVTKQLFSKIKLNPNYHPDKATAMRLCVGARLSLDELNDAPFLAGHSTTIFSKKFY